MPILRSLPVVAIALAALTALHCGTTITSVGGVTDAGAGSDGASTFDGAPSDAGGDKCCPFDGAPTGCRALGGVKGAQGKCEQVCNVGGTYDFQMVTVSGCPRWTYKTRPGDFTCGTSDCTSTVAAPTYCHITVSKATGVQTLYECRPVPADCANDQSCGCISAKEPAVITTCQEVGGIANGTLEVP